MHRGLWNKDHASFFSEATLIEIGAVYTEDVRKTRAVCIFNRSFVDALLRELDWPEEARERTDYSVHVQNARPHATVYVVTLLNIGVIRSSVFLQHRRKLHIMRT